MDEDVEDLGLHVQSRFVEPVSHHVQNISEDFHVVTRVEEVGNWAVFVYVQQDLLKKFQPEVTVCAEFVPEGPDDAVQYGVKIIFL